MIPEYILKWWDTDNVEHRDGFPTFRARLEFINENEDNIVMGELYNRKIDGDHFFYRKFRGNAAQKRQEQAHFEVSERQEVLWKKLKIPEKITSIISTWKKYGSR